MRDSGSTKPNGAGGWCTQPATQPCQRLGRRAHTTVRDRYPVERSALGALAILEQARGERPCRVTVG
jgi:hypothetical protein